MYRCAWGEAWDGVRVRWRALERSLLLEVQAFRIQMWFVRARAALGAGAALGPGIARWRLLRHAAACAQRIEKERTAWGSGLASLLRGGIAAAEHRRDESTARFEAAGRWFDGAEMRAHAAVARRQRSVVACDARGIEDADRVLRRCRVQNPLRLADMLAPGVRPS